MSAGPETKLWFAYAEQCIDDIVEYGKRPTMENRLNMRSARRALLDESHHMRPMMEAAGVPLITIRKALTMREGTNEKSKEHEDFNHPVA